MELNINSPAYFSENFYIDNEVYRLCQKIYMHFRDKDRRNYMKKESIKKRCGFWGMEVGRQCGLKWTSVSIMWRTVKRRKR